MNRPGIFRWLAALLLLFTTLATSLSAAAANAYTISVNTLALSGTQAVAEFQFNPGVDSPAVTATIDAFTGATAAGTSESFGAVSGGVFPGPLVFQNLPTLNSFLQPLTLGASFSFSLSFTDNVPPGNDGSFFGLSFFDNTSGLNPLLTQDPDGVLLAIDLFPGKTPDLTNLSPTFVSIAVIPEPGTNALMLAGLLVLAAGVRGLGFQSRRRLDNSSLRYA